MRVSSDYVEMQTGGKFEVHRMQKGDMTSTKMMIHKVGSARAMVATQTCKSEQCTQVLFEEYVKGVVWHDGKCRK